MKHISFTRLRQLLLSCHKHAREKYDFLKFLLVNKISKPNTKPERHREIFGLIYILS